MSNVVTDIQSLSYNSEVSISPNPTSNELTVRANADIEKIELINITGRVIVSEVVNSKNYKLNLENISNGVYFIKAYNATKQVGVKKLVVQK